MRSDHLAAHEFSSQEPPFRLRARAVERPPEAIGRFGPPTEVQQELTANREQQMGMAKLRIVQEHEIACAIDPRRKSRRLQRHQSNQRVRTRRRDRRRSDQPAETQRLEAEILPDEFLAFVPGV